MPLALASSELTLRRPSLLVLTMVSALFAQREQRITSTETDDRLLEEESIDCRGVYDFESEELEEEEPLLLDARLEDIWAR